MGYEKNIEIKIITFILISLLNMVQNIIFVLEDKEYIIKKLDFTPAEFDAILNAPPKNHWDYPSIITIRRRIKRFKQIIFNN